MGAYIAGRSIGDFSAAAPFSIEVLSPPLPISCTSADNREEREGKNPRTLPVLFYLRIDRGSPRRPLIDSAAKILGNPISDSPLGTANGLSLSCGHRNVLEMDRLC